MVALWERFPAFRPFISEAEASGIPEEETLKYIRNNFIGPAQKRGVPIEEITKYLTNPAPAQIAVEKPEAPIKPIPQKPTSFLGLPPQTLGPEMMTFGRPTESLAGVERPHPLLDPSELVAMALAPMKTIPQQIATGAALSAAPAVEEGAPLAEVGKEAIKGAISLPFALKGLSPTKAVEGGLGRQIIEGVTRKAGKAATFGGVGGGLAEAVTGGDVTEGVAGGAAGTLGLRAGVGAAKGALRVGRGVTEGVRRYGADVETRFQRARPVEGEAVREAYERGRTGEPLEDLPRGFTDDVFGREPAFVRELRQAREAPPISAAPPRVIPRLPPPPAERAQYDVTPEGVAVPSYRPTDPLELTEPMALKPPREPLFGIERVLKGEIVPPAGFPREAPPDVSRINDRYELGRLIANPPDTTTRDAAIERLAVISPEAVRVINAPTRSPEKVAADVESMAQALAGTSKVKPKDYENALQVFERAKEQNAFNQTSTLTPRQRADIIRHPEPERFLRDDTLRVLTDRDLLALKNDAEALVAKGGDARKVIAVVEREQEARLTGRRAPLRGGAPTERKLPPELVKPLTTPGTKEITISGEKPTRAEYEAQGVPPLPDDHPFMSAVSVAKADLVRATNKLLAESPLWQRLKLDTATKKGTLGAALEFQSGKTVENALRSSKVTKETRAAYQQALKAYNETVVAVDAEIERRTIAATSSIIPTVPGREPDIALTKEAAPEQILWWQQGQIPAPLEKILNRVTYEKGRFLTEAALGLSKTERDAVDKWLVSIKHPLAEQAGTQEHRIKEVAKEIVKARSLPTVRGGAPTPLEDIATYETGGLWEALKSRLGDESGQITIRFDPRSRTIAQDVDAWVKETEKILKLKFDQDIKSGMKRFLLAMASAQEVARRVPEFKPIYDAFHRYDREGLDAAHQALRPIANTGFLGERDGMPLRDILDVSKRLIQQRLEAKGQPELSEAGWRQIFGNNDNKVRAALGIRAAMDKLLADWKDFWVEEITAQRVRGGANATVARAETEALINERYQGIDHYVPLSRYGDKAVTIRDRDGNIAHFETARTTRDQVRIIERLQQAFPASEGYTLKANKLKDIVNTKAFDEIHIGAIDLLARIVDLDPRVRDAFMGQVSAELAKRSEAKAHFLHAKETPGYGEDLREPIIRTLESAYQYMSKRRALREANAALAQIPKSKSEVINFASRYIKEQYDASVGWINTLQNATYLYYMALVPKQIALQLTQFPIFIVPEAFKHAPVGWVLERLPAVIERTWFKNPHDTSLERQNLIRSAIKEGALRPRAELFFGMRTDISAFPELALEKQVGELKLSQTSPANQLYRKFGELALLPVTWTDMKTRQAALDLFYEIGRGYLDMTPQDAVKFAIDNSNRTNFLYGPSEAPEVFRGRYRRIFGTMRNWTLGAISFWASHTAEGDFKRVVGPSLATLLALGGTSAYLTSLGIGQLYDLIMGQLTTEDPNALARKFVQTKFGLSPKAVDVLTRGAPTLANIDLSRSLSIGDAIPDASVAGVIGAPASALTDSLRLSQQMLQRLSKGPLGPDPLDVLTTTAPTAVRYGAQAYSLAARGGVTTQKGTVLPGSEKVGPLDIGLTALGVRSAQVADIRQAQKVIETELAQRRFTQSRAVEELARGLKDENQPHFDYIMQVIEKTNKRAEAEQRPQDLIIVTADAIKQRMAEMITPAAALRRTPKLYRGRRMEVERLYGLTQNIIPLLEEEQPQQ